MARVARGAPPTIGLAPTKAGLLLVSIEKSSPRREMAFVPVFSESAVDPLASVNVPLMLLMLTEAMNAVLSPPLGSTPASVMVWLPAGTQKFSVQDR